MHFTQVATTGSANLKEWATANCGRLRTVHIPIQEFLITAADGRNYRTNHYNLDAIISVGYRVKSAVTTRFRIWATQQLREFIVKGFVLDDECLKNPAHPFDCEITIGCPNPNGIESLSPGLERSDYPGRTFVQATTPTGLRQARRADGRNPFRVEEVWLAVSQGNSCRATLGWMTESPWDSPARGLEQAISDNGTETLAA